MTSKTNQYIRWFENLTSDDVSMVGGKNASLGDPKILPGKFAKLTTNLVNAMILKM